MKRRLLLITCALILLAAGSYAGWRLSRPVPDIADAVYADRSDRNVLDIYLAPEAARPAPVIMWIHGGGFEFGDKADPEGLEALRAAGFAVASINYRYSSEAVWPAQRDDVASAIRYLRTNAERFGIDPARIGVWGASAGGSLAATAGTALASDPQTRVQAVVDWFGPVDFSTMDADMAASGVSTSSTLSADSPESRLIGAPVGSRPDLARAASAVAAAGMMAEGVTPPPFLIMHGAQDPLIAAGQSRRLAAALRARGGDVELIILPDGTHGGGGFGDDAALARVVDFLTRQLRPRGGN